MGVGYLTGQGGGGSNIKSIQRGITKILAGTAQTIISINTVDKNKSIEYITYSATAGTNPPYSKNIYTAIEINESGSQLTINRGAVSDIPITVNWTVIEFKNVKSIQRGIMSSEYVWDPALGGAHNDATISAIDISKSVVYMSKTSLTNATDLYELNAASQIINATTIRLYGREIRKWIVVEFK